MHAVVWFAVGLACVAMSGCGSPHEFGEVEGTVTLDGVPVPDLLITSEPDCTLGPPGPRSIASTDAESRFRLYCDLLGRDGAVVARHRVVLCDARETEPSGPESAKRPRKPSPPKRGPKLPTRYENANESPLRIEVLPGKQTIDLALTK